jgi:adenylate kinase
VPQAEALDRMLDEKGLRLDGVVALEVDSGHPGPPDRLPGRGDEGARRAAPPDDNPEVLKQRLAAYQAQTAPLVDYYRSKGALRAVDGMASISDVAAAIGRALPTRRSGRSRTASPPLAPASPLQRSQVRRACPEGCPGRKSASGKAARAKKPEGKVKAAKRAAEDDFVAGASPPQALVSPPRRQPLAGLPERRKKAEKLRARGG